MRIDERGEKQRVRIDERVGEEERNRKIEKERRRGREEEWRRGREDERFN